MARHKRDVKLDTKEARLRLKPRPRPYWHRVSPGLFLGYRSGRWIVRRLVAERTYREKVLAVADDYLDADGEEVLSFGQAVASSHETGQELADTRPTEDYLVKHAIRDYLDWYLHHGKAEGERESQSYRKTETVIKKHILPTLGDRAIVELTENELQTWRDGIALNGNEEMKRSRKSTANRILNTFKAILNHAYERVAGIHIPTNRAWARVKPFRRVSKANIRYLTENECSRLLNGCRPDFRQLVHGALMTGCRFGELRAMRAEDYNPDSEILTVQQGKTGHRNTYLTDEGEALFEGLTAGRRGDEYIFLRDDGDRWQPTQQIRRMKDACDVAKIAPPASFNVTRHSYASHLAMAGVSMRVIAEALGHTSTRMVEKHYGHLSPSYIRRTLREALPRFSDKPRKVRRILR